MVAKCRIVVTFGLALSSRLKKRQQSQGPRGSWVAKRRIVVTCGLAFRRRIPKSQQLYRDRRGPAREMQNIVVTFGFVFRRRVFKVPITGIGGVWVAKRRIVVTFGLAFRRRIPKVSTVTGIGGVLVAKRRTIVTFELAFHRRISSVSTHRDRGGPGDKMQHRRHFWTRVSSLFQTGIVRGLWSRNAGLSSLLDSRLVVASQKSQPSQRSEGSWSQNTELSSLLDSRCRRA